MITSNPSLQRISLSSTKAWTYVKRVSTVGAIIDVGCRYCCGSFHLGIGRWLSECGNRRVSHQVLFNLGQRGLHWIRGAVKNIERVLNQRTFYLFLLSFDLFLRTEKCKTLYYLELTWCWLPVCLWFDGFTLGTNWLSVKSYLYIDKLL